MTFYTPKGFFPIQDIGLINGISEGAQDISPEKMHRLQGEIDAVMLNAYGQRQITQYFTQLNTYWIILEILPDMQTSLESLDHNFVKSPLTGAAVPLSALVDVRVGEVDGQFKIDCDLFVQSHLPAAIISQGLTQRFWYGPADRLKVRVAAGNWP